MSALTAEHRDLIARMGPPEPSGDQTPEQAENLSVDSFLRACDFVGLDRPDEREVREALSELVPAVH